MHLLKAQAGAIQDGADPVDLGQSPGDIVFLTSADSEIAGLARAQGQMGPDAPSLRLANLLQLDHNFSVDVYVEKTLAQAKLIVIRLLGGTGYWPHGVEEVGGLARREGIKLAWLPGSAEADPALETMSTVDAADARRLWSYLLAGGAENYRRFLRHAGHMLGRGPAPPAADTLPPAGAYLPGRGPVTLDEIRAGWQADAPVAAVVFYRALVQGDDLAAIDAVVAGLVAEGINPLPIYVTSLKDRTATATLHALFDAADPGIVLNATAFAASALGPDWSGTALDRGGRPVLQLVPAGMSETAWAASGRGLGPRDLAMHVALPELDGRILARAISFKAELGFDETTEVMLVGHRPRADRVAFTCRLAANWLALQRTAPADRRIGLILSNYPSSDGRLANGVGLDTPASAAAILQAMAAAGYAITDPPADGAAVIARMLAGPSNEDPARTARVTLPRATYDRWFATLPQTLRDAVTARWGTPDQDPFHRDGAFALAVLPLGNIVLGLQPARGYGVDPKTSHHDGELVPPHGYLAFYLWLRETFGAQALVHVGKHGNLEWLPGKALALSADCWPEVVLGPLPHVYPFIANDPGEGTQAKRRATAVIIDHLTPPLTRADSYGALKDLEALVDEYYEAAGMDPRRARDLKGRILDAARLAGLDRDCGIAAGDEADAALEKLDNFLCELKELQIRDGLHVFGSSPTGRQRRDLAVALLRVPRGDGRGRHASLLRALSHDLGLDPFDPLDCVLGARWAGPALRDCRTNGDVVEHLEGLAADLVDGRAPDPGWAATAPVLEELHATVLPRLDASGPAEISALLTALDGRFVRPGPSGAPTRGRLDVLPTGRNFYGLDSRTVPTEAAWRLGKLSAERLVQAYVQEHGAWPRQIAISAWGTANMRTGGDDIAQALALIGVRPVWEASSRRVTGFEVVPLSDLGRPRIDVLFRISGFFRDAFPTQIDLLDSALTAVAALNEPEESNPFAARPGHRIFGNRPGDYGAGIERKLASSDWRDTSDLAQAYLAASGFAYGAGVEGQAARAAFERLVARTDVVVQNQDAREFDLLDSADFAEFQGGLSAAATALSGQRPVLYHNDHSRPERPVIRKLEEEIALALRGRAINPKWLAAIRTHGYKGGSELAATVDNLFAFAALTGAVAPAHFDLIYDAYLVDGRTRDFLARDNPAALRDIARRLAEAIERGLWRPSRNSAHDHLASLAQGGSP